MQDDIASQRAVQRVGSRIGRWYVRSFVRVDGHLVVYTVDRGDAGSVARLETLLPWAAADPSAKGQLYRGVNIAKMVEHAGVPRQIDEGLDDQGVPFVVSELGDGVLLDRVEAGSMSLDDALAVLGSVLGVLDAAHNKRIVHTNIHPGALLFLATRSVRVLDFGHAILQDASRRPSEPARTVFASPEQLRGQWSRVGPSADIYGLASSVFCLITGRLAAPQGAPAPVSLASLMQGIDSDLSMLFDRALAPEPEGRWPNASAMAGALQWVVRKRKSGRSPASGEQQTVSLSGTLMIAENVPAADAEPLTRKPASTLPFVAGRAAAPPPVPVPPQQDTGTLFGSGSKGGEKPLPFGGRAQPPVAAPPIAPAPIVPAPVRLSPVAPVAAIPPSRVGPSPIAARPPEPPPVAPRAPSYSGEEATVFGARSPAGPALPFGGGAVQPQKVVAQTRPPPPAPPRSSPGSPAPPAAPTNELLAVETYATIQAAIWAGQPEHEVLARHGLDEVAWATQQQRMTTAIDDGDGDLAARLTSAIADAVARGSVER